MPRQKKSPTIKAPAGMHDVTPEQQKYWRYVFKKAETLLDDYSFLKIHTSLVEPAVVFTRLFGPTNETLGKELIEVRTKDGDTAVLRYNAVASLLRAYLEHGLSQQAHPVKLSFRGPVFRQGDQPETSERYEIGAEIIGDASEVVDTELLFLAYRILDSMGFHNTVVRINTMGDQHCRPQYVRALKDYYKNRLKNVCAECRDNFKTNTLELLACTEESCSQTIQDAPQAFDYLDESCKTHFRRILEFLDSAKIPYLITPSLVRSPEAYTRTIFEFWLDGDDPSQPTMPLLSGSRHDKMIELLGGSKTPAVGWTIAADTIVQALRMKNASVPDVGIKPKVFLVQLGEAAKRKSLLLFEDIRKAGIEVKYSLSRDSIKSQLRIAERLGVRFTLIFGQKEAIEGTVILREMETGIQETIPLEKIVEDLKKRLKK